MWGNGGGYGANHWGIQDRSDRRGGGGPQRRGHNRRDQGNYGGNGGGFQSGGYGGYGGGYQSGFGGGSFVNGPQIPITDMDPMVEKLSVEYNAPEETATEATAVVNSNQLQCIIGRDGMRLEELKTISGASIKYEVVAEDSCLTNIMVSKGNESGPSSIVNAVWLMNICLNAFCPPAVSLAPFDPRRPLEEVVCSQRFGPPPGLAGGQQQQQA